jgi:hypothetical protein
MNKKIILIVLTICLLLTGMPIQVRAEQTTLLDLILNLFFPQPEIPRINILNPVSKPTLWGRWVVEFETNGEGDLEIQAYRGTYFEKDIEFLWLYCGDKRIEIERYFSEGEEWVEGRDNGKIVVKNWNCDKRAKLVLRILETGHHYLRFSFLGSIAYAENLADCTGTDVSPCYLCDVDAVNITIYTNQSSTGPYAMTYASTSGICQYIQGDTDFSTSENWINTSNVTFNVAKGGRTTVRIGGPAWRYIRSVRSFTIAQSIKVDFYTEPTSGTQHVIAFNSGDSSNRFAVHYVAPDNYFRMQVRINGGPWTYPFTFPLSITKNSWYSIELIWYANGTAEAWLYPSGGSRNSSNYYSNSSFPANWNYYIYSWNNDQYSYLSLFRNTNVTLNETWTYSLGYTFCPKEEKYLGFINSHSQGDVYEWENLTVFSEETGTNTVSAYSKQITAESFILTSDGVVSPYKGSYMIKYNGTYDANTGNDYAYHRLRDENNNNILNGYQIREGNYLYFCVYAEDSDRTCGMEINFYEPAGEGCGYLRWNHYDQDGYTITKENNPATVDNWYCIYTNISDKAGCTINYLSLVQENDKDSTTFTCYYDEIMITSYLYTVNWDNDQNWCDCKMGATGCNGQTCWGVGFDSGTSASCCGDDAGEYYRYCNYVSPQSGFPDSGDCISSDNMCCDASNDCVNTAGSACTASGSTSDADGDGDVDYCLSNKWYDCYNNDAHCTRNGINYICIDYDCTNVVNGGSGTTCDATNKCLLIQNSTGSTKARFDSFGYVDVKGSYLYDQSSLSPPAGSFIVRNSTGTTVLYVDKDGNLATLGRFYNQASPTPSGGDDFIIKDSSATVVGYIDGATGNMYFKGDLHYNSNF